MEIMEVCGAVADALAILASDSIVTKRAKNDYNTMDDKAFFNKYSCSKELYAKRVAKYGDPYMNSPLAKIGKVLSGKRL